MRTHRWPVAACVVLAVAACHKVSEDGPSSQVVVATDNGNPYFPEAVPVPGATPQPVAVPTAVPRTTTTNPTPRPVGTPTPTPATQAPSNNTTNSGATGNERTPRDGVVAKVGAKVYFVECDGVHVPDTELATSAPVGCRVHFDCTPKDSTNYPVKAQGLPNWSFSNPSLVSVNDKNDYTPTALVRAPGHLTAWVVIDGVRSNDVDIDFN